MDWANEPYVKAYTRETDDDLALSWEALAVWRAMLLRFDRSGVIETKRRSRGLAAVVRIPFEVVDRALPELLEDGRIREVPMGYFAPNYIEAQEATKSDKLRQKESRERRRSRNLDHPVTKRDATITNRDESVTSSHDASRDVTLCSASSADQDPLQSAAPARARTIPRTGPGTEPVPDPEPETTPPRLTSTPARSRDDLRRKLWNDAWTLAGLEHAKLKAEGIDPHARNCWSGIPPADSPESVRLFERIDELLIGNDFEATREKIRNRVLVAAAEARHKLHHLEFFTPMRMWEPKSFAIAEALSPEQIARSRAGPRGASRETDDSEIRRYETLK